MTDIILTRTLKAVLKQVLDTSGPVIVSRDGGMASQVLALRSKGSDAQWATVLGNGLGQAIKGGNDYSVTDGRVAVDDWDIIFTTYALGEADPKATFPAAFAEVPETEHVTIPSTDGNAGLLKLTTQSKYDPHLSAHIGLRINTDWPGVQGLITDRHRLARLDFHNTEVTGNVDATIPRQMIETLLKIKDWTLTIGADAAVATFADDNGEWELISVNEPHPVDVAGLEERLTLDPGAARLRMPAKELKQTLRDLKVSAAKTTKQVVIFNTDGTLANPENDEVADRTIAPKGLDIELGHVTYPLALAAQILMPLATALPNSDETIEFAWQAPDSTNGFPARHTAPATYTVGDRVSGFVMPAAPNRIFEATETAA